MKKKWLPHFKLFIGVIALTLSISIVYAQDTATLIKDGERYLETGSYSQALDSFKQVVRLNLASPSVIYVQKMIKYIEVRLWGDTQLDKIIQTKHLNIHYSSNLIPQEEIDLLANAHEAKLNQIVKTLGVDFNRRVEVFLYPAVLEDEIWEARQIFSDRATNEIHCFYNGANDHGHIVHDLVHIVSFGLVTEEQAREIYPLLKEGLAEYLAGEPWGRPVDKWAAGFLQEGKMIPLSRLLDADFFRNSNPVSTYTLAASFVKYLIEHYGMEKFKQMYCNNSFVLAYGNSLPQLEKEWINHLSQIKVSAEDLDLFNYRLWLGGHYQKNDSELEPLPWLGIEYSVVGDGVVITDIIQNSPAHQAGLRKGDVIAKVDGVALDAKQAWRLNFVIQTKKIGDRVNLAVRRDWKLNNKFVVLGRRPGW